MVLNAASYTFSWKAKCETKIQTKPEQTCCKMLVECVICMQQHWCAQLNFICFVYKECSEELLMGLYSLEDQG